MRIFCIHFRTIAYTMQISPILGPPLMLVFVCLTNILLITSLISLLSASLSRVSGHVSSFDSRRTRIDWLTAPLRIQVMEHSRDEYLFVYALLCCASSSNARCGQSQGDANDGARYSVYVLESATSNRLTYFVPPLVSFTYFRMYGDASILQRVAEGCISSRL